MIDDTTTTFGESWLSGARSEREERAHVLTVAWSISDADLLGHSAIVARAGEWTLGRGGAGPEEFDRLFFRARRPREAGTPTPLSGRGISRDQLRFHIDGETLFVRRTGKCPLAVDGQPTEEAPLEDGSVIALKNQLVLVHTERPRHLPDVGGAEESPFGVPDAHGIVGESWPTWALRREIHFVAKSDRHVLVLGESGVGKELAARAIHAGSSRSPHALVARNAATLPEGIVDAELFGNLKDYPNPGTPERPGVIGDAHRGSLFLDEIGELPESLQAHLLRVLDGGGEYQRLGDSRTRQSDFRLIAATNREVEELKSDLAARLPLRLAIPPVRDRVEDIPLLVRHLLRQALSQNPHLVEQFCEHGDDANPRIQPELIEALLRERLPMNVRELDTILWVSLRTSAQHFLELTPEVRRELDPPRPSQVPKAAPTAEEIAEALEACEGNQTRAATQLGLSSRYVLYRLMRKHGIATPSRD